MEQVTVILTDTSSKVLEVRAAVNGDTRTDTINRALQIYNHVERIFDAGGWRAWLLRHSGVRYTR